MQEYIDIIFKYWYIFLPLLIAILIVIWLLIRRGYLQEINLFGLRFSLKHESSDDKKYRDNPRKSSPSLRDYKINFTKTALENISFLNITQDAIIRSVENEFAHHINYFMWDLSDYPLPVQNGYIIVMDKVSETVTFRSIKRADFNELELASLNDLLTIYRRLSRFEYRYNKQFILRPQAIASITDQHKELIRRLIHHYEMFRGITLLGKEKFPMLFLKYLSEPSTCMDMESKMKEFVRKSPSNSKGFGLNVIAATSALHNIGEIIANEENGLLAHNEADKETVLCMERSLQYIHKMINACLE